MSHVKDKVAIVTGASSGIGAATARGLAEKGARVVLAGRNQKRLSQIVEEIADSGGVASYQVADATDFESTKTLVAFATTTYSPVDILVNNAGLMLFSYWKDAAVGDWNKMIDTNLRGYLHAIAAVLPSMLERRSGRILNMSSIAGFMSARRLVFTEPRSSSYAVSPKASERRWAWEAGSRYL